MTIRLILAKSFLYLFILMATGAAHECCEVTNPQDECVASESSGPEPRPTPDWRFTPEQLQVMIDMRFHADDSPSLERTEISIDLRAGSDTDIEMTDSRFYYNAQRYPFEPFAELLSEGPLTYEDVNLVVHMVPLPGSTDPFIVGLPLSVSTTEPLELRWNGPPIGDNDKVSIALTNGSRRVDLESTEPGATSIVATPAELVRIGPGATVTLHVERETLFDFQGPGGGEILRTEIASPQTLQFQ